jgi:uncharacterized glyoxalase superfamily protein PhnB
VAEHLRPDPLDVLAVPVDRPLPETGPDPAFAAGLRTRLERVLLSDPRPPGGGPVTGALTPYLVVHDARAALAFYAEAFGAVPRGEAYVQDDGRIGHAEVEVAGALVMLADEFPELGLLGPLARGGVSTTLHLEVPEVDAAVDRAVAAGADLERPAADAAYGRTAVVRDPAGHRWMLQSPAHRTVPGVAYVTVVVPDAEVARAFYGAVLGWEFAPGSVEDGWSVEGTSPSVGLWGGQPAAQVQLCYRVDDLDGALAAVRAGGGEAQEPQAKPYGRLAECSDPAGLRFQLWEG